MSFTNRLHHISFREIVFRVDQILAESWTEDWVAGWMCPLTFSYVLEFLVSNLRNWILRTRLIGSWKTGKVNPSNSPWGFQGLFYHFLYKNNNTSTRGEKESLENSNDDSVVIKHSCVVSFFFLKHLNVQMISPSLSPYQVIVIIQWEPWKRSHLLPRSFNSKHQQRSYVNQKTKMWE